MPLVRPSRRPATTFSYCFVGGVCGIIHDVVFRRRDPSLHYLIKSYSEDVALWMVKFYLEIGTDLRLEISLPRPYFGTVSTLRLTRSREAVPPGLFWIHGPQTPLPARPTGAVGLHCMAVEQSTQ